MATLYEISKTIEDVIERGYHVDEETGEYFDEEMLDNLEMDYEEKLENVALFCKNLDAEADAIAAEAKILSERAKAKRNKSERLKGYMATSMVSMNKTELDKPKVRLSFRKSTSVNVYQEDSIPAEYINEKVTKSVDKTAIRKAIKNGETIPGANLVESLNLQVK